MTRPTTYPSTEPRSRELLAHAGAQVVHENASEGVVAAVDGDDVAGVVTGGVAGEVHRDAREIVAATPAPFGHPWQHIGDEAIPAHRRCGHLRFDPARQHRVRTDAVTGVLHCDPLHHRVHARLRGAVVLP